MADAVVVIEVALQNGEPPGDVAARVAVETSKPVEEVNALTDFLGGLALVPSSVRVRVDSATPDQASLTVAVTQANIAAGETFTLEVPGLGTWTFTALASGADTSAYQFNSATSNAATATSMAAAINASPGTSRLFVASTNSGNLIITSAATGPVGNTYRMIDGTVNGLSPAGGSLSGAAGVGERASGSIAVDTFANITANTDTNTVGTTVLTWVASAANENQVTIGADADAAVTNLAAAINAHSTLSGIVSASANTTDDTVEITYLGSAREGLLCRIAVSDATAQTATAMAVTGALAASQATRTYTLGAAS